MYIYKHVYKLNNLDCSFIIIIMYYTCNLRPLPHYWSIIYIKFNKYLHVLVSKLV